MKLRLRHSSVARGIEQSAGMALCLCASAIAAMLAQPTATRADTVYVSNWSSDSIVRFTADGVGSIFYSGGSESFRPTGLARLTSLGLREGATSLLCPLLTPAPARGSLLSLAPDG